VLKPFCKFGKLLEKLEQKRNAN